MAFALDGYAQNNRLIDHALRLVGHLAHSITRHSSTFSPYGSTFQADRKRDLARLDEESADLALLQTNLDKMAGLTDKMVGMLISFDDRLVNLEASILPIHKSTQRLTHLQDNIDKTLKAVDNITTYLDLVSKEERFITKGPDEQEILPYLKAMARIKDALEYLEQKKLKACDKVMGQMRQLLKAGMLHLETLFRKWLSAASEPINPHAFLKDSETHTMSSTYFKNLSQLSQYISSSEAEIGYAVDFTKPYIDIRSAFLVKTLQPMAQASLLGERVAGSHYERGGSGFLKYMECAVRMFKAESDLATKLLPNPAHRLNGYRGAIQPALTELAGTGRQLNLSIRRSGTHSDTIMLLDVLDEYNHELRTLFDEVIRGTQKKEDEVQDVINALSATAVRSFVEFIDEVKGKKDKDAAMSADGTVAELTSATLNHLKRLLDWQEIVETMLLTLGDGNWNSPGSASVPESLSLNPPARNPAIGVAIVKHYYGDVLDILVSTLTVRSKTYKRPALASIFLLNNFNHIARQLRSPALSAVADEEMQTRFAKLVRRQIDGYQDSWKACAENLMDVTYVKGGALKTNLGNSDKQIIKDKFKNFNTDFEEMYRAQKSYAMPDQELRNQVLREVKQVLLPLYSRFVDKYQGTDFTKNPAKYIKYDRDQLERMINQFFEPSA